MDCLGKASPCEFLIGPTKKSHLRKLLGELNASNKHTSEQYLSNGRLRNMYYAYAPTTIKKPRKHSLRL